MCDLYQATYEKLLGRTTLLGSVVLMYCTPAIAQTKGAPTLEISDAIVTAAITGLVGGAGWIAAYILNSQREDRTKRLQLTIEHTSTQMREFYAPLVALTDQLNTMAFVKTEATRGKSQEVDYDLTATFYDKFFLPIHEEINAILKTKVHLLEGAITPSSFAHYFRHYASEKAYWQLVHAGKDVRHMEVPEFPAEFYHDVRRGYQVVLDRYEQGLEEMRHPRLRWLFTLHPAKSSPRSATVDF
jgi:hypothetical protein